ncbi:LysR family transcriptional regulator [Micromonospora mangrovi]|uniref:LysR family transcriptional regulator n=2 Tax=Micromonospora TaxID=1873 RepID=A0AAU7MAB8_9ACTN
MELEVRQLRVFLAVARSESFSRAALFLGLTQPAVTAHVKRLERHFGLPLFARTTRMVRLTEAGRRLLPLAERVVFDLAEVDRVMAGGSPATFRFGAEAPALTRILGPLRRLLPTTDFDVVVELSERSVAQIRAGQRHAAQVYDFEVSPLPLDGLGSVVLDREPIWAVLPRSHRLAEAPAVALAELAGDPWVLRPTGQRLRRFVVEACRSAGFEPRVRHAATDGTAIEYMIADHGCVTLGSPINLGSPHYVQRPLADPVERTLRLVWSTGEVAHELVVVVADLMRGRYLDAALTNNPEYGRTLLDRRRRAAVPAAGAPAAGRVSVPPTGASVLPGPAQ